MRVIPPYPDYQFFRGDSGHFCSRTLCDLSILAYSDIDFIEKVRMPFRIMDWVDVKGTQALVVEDQRADEMAIVFRGTSTFCIGDWMRDFNAEMNKSGMHEGFHEAFRVALPRIQKSLSNRRVFLSGHSLGGALATIAAWYMPADLVTFGSPRVGSAEFARQVMKQCGSYCERYVHGRDVVPTLPPKSMGYEHVFDETRLVRTARPWSNILVPNKVFDHVPTLYADRLWQ